VIQARGMSGHGPKLMDMQPSRFQWHKFKDTLHFYVMLGLIPVTAIVFYANVFIGPATLTETPEGYVPKHWEFHRHPITRFLARYIYPSPQQEYEKHCHMLYEENEKALIR
jgi:NADH dehydrogenase (ubiquinone) 1 beta subcomplex subunit 5